MLHIKGKKPNQTKHSHPHFNWNHDPLWHRRGDCEYFYFVLWRILLFYLSIYFDHREHTLLWWSNHIYHCQNMAPGMYFNILLTDNHLSSKPARLLVDTPREGGRQKSSTHKYNSNSITYSNLLHFPSSPCSDGLAAACVRMSHALVGRH